MSIFLVDPPAFVAVLTPFPKFQVPYELTPEGFETQFAVNHLSHALLTLLLLPKLEEQGSEGNPARVINVISTHYVKGRLIEENFKPRFV